MYVPRSAAAAAVAKHYADDPDRKRFADSLAGARGGAHEMAEATASRAEAAAELPAVQLADIDAHLTLSSAAGDRLTIALPLADDAPVTILFDRLEERWRPEGFGHIRITSDINVCGPGTIDFPAPRPLRHTEPRIQAPPGLRDRTASERVTAASVWN
jgi:hypothetical protein